MTRSLAPIRSEGSGDVLVPTDPSLGENSDGWAGPEPNKDGEKFLRPNGGGPMLNCPGGAAPP